MVAVEHIAASQCRANPLGHPRQSRVRKRRRKLSPGRLRRVVPHVRIEQVHDQEKRRLPTFAQPGQRAVDDDVGPTQPRIPRRREIVGVETAIQPESRPEERVIDHRGGGETGRGRRFRHGGKRRVELPELATGGRATVGASDKRAGLMPGWELSGEHRADGRQRPWRRAERMLEDSAAFGPRIQMRASRSVVAVDAEMIGAQRVHDDQQDRAHGRSLTAGPDDRQPDTQSEPEHRAQAHGSKLHTHRAGLADAAGWFL